MSWLAILLTLASLGGSPAPGEVKPRKQCSSATKQKAAKAKDCKPKKKTKGKSKPKKAKPKKTPTANAQPRNDPATGSPEAQRDDPQPKPGATPVPPAAPGTTPTPTPTPAPPGTYPTRTNVDLDEWFVRPSYRILAAGPIEFNVNNRGEDDHNLAVRGGGREYGKLDVPPGESDMLTVTLGLGSYTLYCSLPDHEEAGMRVDISVR